MIPSASEHAKILTHHDRIKATNKILYAFENKLANTIRGGIVSFPVDHDIHATSDGQAKMELERQEWIVTITSVESTGEFIYNVKDWHLCSVCGRKLGPLDIPCCDVK